MLVGTPQEDDSLSNGVGETLVERVETPVIMAMPAMQSSGLSSAEQAEVSRMVSGVTDHYYRMMYLSSSASAQADESSQAGGGPAAGGDGGSESIQVNTGCRAPHAYK